MNLSEKKVQAIFPRDKNTLDMLWNRYVNKIFKCWEYENGSHMLEYIDYKTLQFPFDVIKFGDYIYETKSGTTDAMIFWPINCPYHFLHTFSSKGENLEMDYSHYVLTVIEKEFDFKRFVKENGKMLNQFVFESTMLYLMILYMNQKPEYIQNEEIPRWKAKQKESDNEYKNNYKYTKVVKSYSVLKEQEEKQHYQIQCPVWSVRGHYRHYKNGNIVFIKSYKKGKQKDKVEPTVKNYKI